MSVFYLELCKGGIIYLCQIFLNQPSLLKMYISLCFVT